MIALTAPRLEAVRDQLNELMREGDEDMVDNINGMTGMGGMQSARREKTAYRMSGMEAPASTDSVELTSDVMRLKGVEGIRMDRVMKVKSQIAAGNYFTEEKLSFSLDRALDHLEKKILDAR
ncbi:MAG: flagellar biosynthesis anti-sigma factor FlgM [Planctomycetes bacterium]|nr:flagellar biosynthesis anti-sigma factor FlgM [Planctomycetota bacterium]